MAPRWYLQLLRAAWPAIAAAAVLVAALSVLLAAREPARYGAEVTLLLTRSEDRRFDTEDALAYDAPAIIAGRPFAAAVAAHLASQGVAVGSDDVRAMLRASNQRRVVTLAASATRPELALAVSAAARDILIERGLMLWADPLARPGATGLNVVVLDQSTAASRLNGPMVWARDAVLRAAVAAWLVFALQLAIRTYHNQGAPCNSSTS
jgi:hypothetical protein